MARLTAFHADGRVFESEGAALIGVALEAGFFTAEGLLDHPGPLRHSPRGRECAMRVVAIGTLHEPFVDAVLRGHLELGAHGGVTGVTEFALLFGKEILRRGGA